MRQLRWSYIALRCDVAVPLATTLSKICLREYALTIDAFKKQSLSPNKVSSGFERWTSTNKLAMTAVIGYYIERNGALHQVQLSVGEVDHVFFSGFER